MAATEILVQDWDFYIDTTGAGNWVAIAGITSMTPNGPTAQKANTGTKDDDGWDKHIVSLRGKSIALKGKFQEDPSDGSRDSGQEAVEIAAQQVGDSGGYDYTTDSIVLFKIEGPGDNQVEEFAGSVEMGDQLGDYTEAADWACTITYTGKPSTFYTD